MRRLMIEKRTFFINLIKFIINLIKHFYEKTVYFIRRCSDGNYGFRTTKMERHRRQWRL